LEFWRAQGEFHGCAQSRRSEEIRNGNVTRNRG
jgi:hypothetical protein